MDVILIGSTIWCLRFTSCFFFCLFSYFFLNYFPFLLFIIFLSFTFHYFLWWRQREKHFLFCLFLLSLVFFFRQKNRIYLISLYVKQIQTKKLSWLEQDKKTHIRYISFNFQYLHVIKYQQTTGLENFHQHFWSL